MTLTFEDVLDLSSGPTIVTVTFRRVRGEPGSAGIVSGWEFDGIFLINKHGRLPEDPLPVEDKKKKPSTSLSKPPAPPSPPMPKSRNWRPVYPNKDHRRPDLWSKVGSYVSREDFSLINSVLAQSGGISYIIDHAIKSTADIIRAHGFKYPDDTARLILWLRERSFSEPPPVAEGETGNDRRRTSESNHGVENPSLVTASLWKDVTTGSVVGDAGKRRDRLDKLRRSKVRKKKIVDKEVGLGTAEDVAGG